VTVDAPHLRPLGIGEILDVALKIVWRNLRTLMSVVIFIVLPVQIVSAVINVSAAGPTLDTFGDPGTPLTRHDAAAFAGATVTTTVLAFLASTLASGACYRAIASAYLGERTGWRESLRYALRFLPSILLVTILTALAAMLGLVLCVVPGVYFWIAFSLAVPALLTENCRGRKALRRSRELVAGFWWRVLAISALGYLLSAILGGALSGTLVGITAFDYSGDSLTGATIGVIAQTFSSMVTTPFVAAFVTVLYFDLRVRKEGFDLQLLAERIGVAPPAGALTAALPDPPGDSGDQPPFWPPPPGWKPGGGK
jgi:hypothetical protein